ncbi:MAG: dTMP kinase [Candidatus Pacearchaeota archaeon]|nr:dTMP kinase [Candidatus Pacearchaeota archaeon]
MAEEKKGLFIVFDGIDGSGKSTALLNFANYLARKDKHFHLLVTREPYKKREIREILRSESNPYIQKEKIAKLFVDDRREHAFEVIFPNLKSGVHVISDRYKYATLVYQTVQGLEFDKLVAMHVNMPVPDIVFIIDVPVEVSSKRMSSDTRTEQKFEANKNFLDQVRHGYLALPYLLPSEKIVIIDGSKSIQEVNKQIIEEFEKFIENS